MIVQYKTVFAHQNLLWCCGTILDSLRPRILALAVSHSLIALKNFRITDLF